MAVNKRKPIKAEEYIVPGEQDKESLKNSELLDGKIIHFTSPNEIHQTISLEIATELNIYIKNNNNKGRIFTAPFNVKLDDRNIVQPDIIVVCGDSKLNGGKRCMGAPDLVVEVTTAKRSVDFNYKVCLYNNYGVREYWIVDIPHEKVIVYDFEECDSPDVYPFDYSIPVSIYNGELAINIQELLEQ